MLTTEQKNQFNEILEELGQTLDISETQYNVAVKSYEAVGKWLADDESPLAPYSPEILPQGSFMLGTMIKPITETDDIDIDLVCQLKGKDPIWTQFDLKSRVGDRIKDKATYKSMLDKEGRRCWTLKYRQESDNRKETYHLDILPCIVDSNYRIVLEKAFSTKELSDLSELAIRITDKHIENYFTEEDHLNWLKSNPFGYGRWFYYRASIEIRKAFSINESIQPVPKYQKEKLPLQRVIQILKRHRDIMFNGDKDKPISIIITTLAAQAYNKETDIHDALRNVVDKMEQFIEDYNPHTGEAMKWIQNPVNNHENFADKWVENPKKQENFYSWLKQLKLNVSETLGHTELIQIMESMKKPFGDDTIQKAFTNLGNKAKLLTEEGKNRIDTKLGVTLSGASTIKSHTFYGSWDEE